jgi:hypothetical protein
LTHTVDDSLRWAIFVGNGSCSGRESLMLKNCLFVFTILGAACASDKQDGKGVVDQSSPPDVPTELGKADASSKEVPVSIQSAHPYTNGLDRAFSVPLTGLPSCASRARIHFKVLRTEDNYDFVVVEPTGAASQSFDGSHDGLWSDWFDMHGDHVNVRLTSDGSVTRHGFEIDKLEWSGGAVCPAIAWPTCGAGTVDVVRPIPVCGCPSEPTCATLADVQISHATRRGFNARSHQITGSAASETHPGLADGAETTAIGSVDLAKVSKLLHDAAQAGLFQIAPYDHTIAAGATRDELHIVAGPYDVTFVSGEGTHAAKVAQVIADFEALFSCDATASGLTCGSGFACAQNECVEQQGCLCPANHDPVCGENSHTYENGCAAACANVAVGHAGECGLAGDACGTMLGLSCADDLRCRFGASRFEYPFPDAGGTCVAHDYCDAPADCNGQAHPAVLGAWACNANACAWRAGAQWQSVPNGGFESAHPYASSTSVWKEVYLPANAQAMRVATASFRLERNYDFLEVWTWKNGAWALDKRFTGTTGPAITEEFAGRYHYLRFVSDSSVNDQGFVVTADWR